MLILPLVSRHKVERSILEGVRGDTLDPHISNFFSENRNVGLERDELVDEVVKGTGHNNRSWELRAGKPKVEFDFGEIFRGA